MLYQMLGIQEVLGVCLVQAPSGGISTGNMTNKGSGSASEVYKVWYSLVANYLFIFVCLAQLFVASKRLLTPKLSTVSLFLFRPHICGFLPVQLFFPFTFLVFLKLIELAY